MMAPGDEKLVATRIVEMSVGQAHANPVGAASCTRSANLSGRWQVDIRYTAGANTTHTLVLSRTGIDSRALIRADFLARDIAGTISGETVSLASIVTERQGDSHQLSIQRARSAATRCRAR